MKERLVRIAKWNQRVLGALLLAIVYMLSIGPASLMFKLCRLVGLVQREPEGWVPLKRTEVALGDLKEQS